MFQWDGGLDLGLGYGDEKASEGPFELPSSVRPGDSLLAQLPPGFKVNVMVEEQYGARVSSSASASRKPSGQGGRDRPASAGTGRERGTGGAGGVGGRSKGAAAAVNGGGGGGGGSEEKEARSATRCVDGWLTLPVRAPRRVCLMALWQSCALAMARDRQAARCRERERERESTWHV